MGLDFERDAGYNTEELSELVQSHFENASYDGGKLTDNEVDLNSWLYLERTAIEACIDALNLIPEHLRDETWYMNMGMYIGERRVLAKITEFGEIHELKQEDEEDA